MAGSTPQDSFGTMARWAPPPLAAASLAPEEAAERRRASPAARWATAGCAEVPPPPAPLQGVQRRTPKGQRTLRVAPPAEGGPDVACAICLEAAATRAWRRLSCGHGFHEGCILRWVQHAHHAHCPMCRSDLEASALSEFEADFQAFRKDLDAWHASPGERAHELSLALVGAERCRRRLYDAALARFLKLLAAAARDGDTGMLQEVRGLVKELLDECQKLREVLERRRSSRARAKVASLQGPAETSSGEKRDAQLLESLGGEFSHFHALLESLCEAHPCQEEAARPDEAVQSLDPQLAGEVCCGLREHLGQVRQLCKSYAEVAPARPRIGGA